MTNPVETIALNGSEITLTLRQPVRGEWQALAAAAAVRVLESYPVVERVVMHWGDNQFCTTRTHVEHLLRPDGFAAIASRSRWQEVVNRLVLDPTGKKPSTV